MTCAGKQPTSLQALGGLKTHACASSLRWGAARASPLPGPRATGACRWVAPRRRGAARRSAQQVVASSGASHEPYPWRMADYHRVALQMVQTGAPAGLGPQQGYFLLMRVDDSEAVQDGERGMIMAVSGDTLAGVAQLAQGLPSGGPGGRPLALDLLWQVLQRGQEVSKRSWAVLRVAVVELRGSTFVGRIFFGDPATGLAAWDCDCRPSDACWLALKSRAPIYVNREVWEESAMLLQEVKRSAEARQAAAGPLFALDEVQGEEEGSSAFAMMTTPRVADPEPLKRLKMEMRVAIKDEDYVAAARIRDHPWMRLHLSSLRAAQEGDAREAARCQAELESAMQQHARDEREGARRRHAEEQRRRRAQQQHDSSGGDQRGPGRQFW